ncbi:MAG: glycosyltransferase [Desulfobacterales bacterium]|nr:glycosyltransferase [Desulfobacterales bacterium]
MDSNGPKISVIVPTYNRAAMLGGCIDAVLSQTMQDFELVIVSDGSIDATKDVVLGYKDARILFFEKENGGQASARNLGIRKSSGKYISLCDDDDRFYPHHLSTLTKLLNDNSGVGMVYSDAIWVYGNGSRKPEVKFSEDFDKKALENFNYITTQTVLFRRSCLKNTDLFNEDQHLRNGLEDWEFFLRLSDNYAFSHIKKVSAEYVVHEGNSFHPGSGYDYSRAFFHVRTQRFEYLTAEFGPFLFDRVDHMYPYNLVQCYLDSGKIKESREIADKLHRLYMTYSKNNNKAPFAELVIFFSLGISHFAAGYETEAGNFFRIIVEHPSYTLIREQFDGFANQYANRIPNMGLKTLLGNCFIV